MARSNPEPIFLAVHRLDYMVYYRRLAAGNICFSWRFRTG